MRHTLTLDIPDEVSMPLQQQAQHAGKTPEEAVLAWLARTVQRLADAPLLQLAGGLASTVTDARGRHDAV